MPHSLMLLATKIVEWMFFVGLVGCGEQASQLQTSRAFDRGMCRGPPPGG